jgi:hypothetical protein
MKKNPLAQSNRMLKDMDSLPMHIATGLGFDFMNLDSEAHQCQQVMDAHHTIRVNYLRVLKS